MKLPIVGVPEPPEEEDLKATILFEINCPPFDNVPYELYVPAEDTILSCTSCS